MNQTTVLASIASKGVVRVCPAGCVHVTYSGVTLDFATGSFGDFAETLEQQHLTPEITDVEVVCFHVTMHFTPEEYREFAGLVSEGKWRLGLWGDQQLQASEDRSRRLPRLLSVQEGVFSQN